MMWAWHLWTAADARLRRVGRHTGRGSHKRTHTQTCDVFQLRCLVHGEHCSLDSHGLQRLCHVACSSRGRCNSKGSAWCNGMNCAAAVGDQRLRFTLHTTAALTLEHFVCVLAQHSADVCLLLLGTGLISHGDDQSSCQGMVAGAVCVGGVAGTALSRAWVWRLVVCVLASGL